MYTKHGTFSLSSTVYVVGQSNEHEVGGAKRSEGGDVNIQSHIYQCAVGAKQQNYLLTGVDAGDML